MIETVTQLAETVSVAAACRALDVPRSDFYRGPAPAVPVAQPPRPAVASPRALTPQEKAQVRELLNSTRFQDQAPREVYATLQEEGLYLCHWRSKYRILEEFAEVRARRMQQIFLGIVAVVMILSMIIALIAR